MCKMCKVCKGEGCAKCKSEHCVQSMWLSAMVSYVQFIVPYSVNKSGKYCLHIHACILNAQKTKSFLISNENQC